MKVCLVTQSQIEMKQLWLIMNKKPFIFTGLNAWRWLGLSNVQKNKILWKVTIKRVSMNSDWCHG